MQIDGAVNNDVFAISSSSTPGSAAGTQPISLDAIQEVQIALSPYDVRQGGFSGGSVNAVTKSGGNTFSGTAYWFQRSQALVGDLPSLTSVASPTPTDTRSAPSATSRVASVSAGRLGRTRRSSLATSIPAGRPRPRVFRWTAPLAQPWLHTAEVQQILDIAKNQYRYDAGGLDEVSPPPKTTSIFLRTDFNLSPKHR